MNDKTKSNVSRLKSLRKSSLDFTPETKDELNKFNKNIHGLNESIKTLDDKISKPVNDSRSDNAKDINENINPRSIENINKSLNTLDSSISSFYKKLNDKIANDPSFEMPPVKESPTASVSSKLEDPVAIEDPKIVSLLSSIYDEVRKQPEENILNKEEIIRNQDTTTDTIEKTNTILPDLHKKKEDLDKKNQHQTNTRLDSIVKAVRIGFIRSLALSDRISTFLFRYSITAAAKFAKMTAIILALIVPLDLLQLYIRKFIDNLDFDALGESINSMMDSTKEFFSNIGDRISDGLDMFKDNLTSEIQNMKDVLFSLLDGAITPIQNLGSEIAYQMTRVISSILGKIPGMGSKADTMKLGGIEQHLSKGNSINSADMDFLLEHRLKEVKNTTAYEDIKDLPKQEQLEMLRTKEELQIRLNKVEHDMKTRYMDKNRESALEEELINITNDTTNSEISKASNMEIDILSKVTEIRNKIGTNKDVESIDEDKNITSSIENNTTNTTNNTQIVNQVSRSKTLIQKNVQTSTHAPGMYGYTA